VAAAAADVVVVTSDNPRSEDPESIAADIVAGVPAGRAHVELDRAKAIAWVLERAQSGDAVLIAGKGHERTQEVAGVFHPFDDRDVAASLLAGGR
jgi:UDP-N-acetylmuramoyl-L-alanyl-D-glutamate--2,6-diaminopimelate ligase